ncbi:MAG: hypothetical protein ABI053_09385 [Lacisediminihabitans sp.]
MTAWQDQAPQSRRQLRLNERGDAHDGDARSALPKDGRGDVAVSVEPSSPEHSTQDQSAQDQPTRDQSTHDQSMHDQLTQNQATVGHPAFQPPQGEFGRPEWDAPARRDAATLEAPASAAHQPRSRAEAAVASGRRSQHSFPNAVPGPAHEPPGFVTSATQRPESAEAEAPGAEPLNYFTQGRSQVPVYGGPSFGVNAVTPPPVSADSSDQSDGSTGNGENAGSYRIRDFSPESRRNAFSSTEESSVTSSAVSGGNLDYYTQQGSGGRAAEAQAPTELPVTELAAPELAATVGTRGNDAVAEGASAEEAPAEEAPTEHAPGGAASTEHAPAGHLASVAPDDDTSAEHAASASEQSELVADALSVVTEAPAPHVEHTMTRRELRALRESSGIDDFALVAAAVSPTQGAPNSVSPAQNAPAEPSAEHSEPTGSHSWSIDQPASPASEHVIPAESAAPDPVPLRAPIVSTPQSSRQLSDAMAEFDALMARDSGPVQLPAAQAEVAASVSGFDTERVSEHTERGRDVGGEPVEAKGTAGINDAWDNTGGGDATLAQTPEPARGDRHFVAPAGHWSRQAEDYETHGDGSQAAETEGAHTHAAQAQTAEAQAAEAQAEESIALSRNIGAAGGSFTANHLVISSVPTVNDLLKPFSPTGEIMITGTIDLPRSLGTTGAHPARYDHSDVDTLLEASDREDSNVDSAPVRAIRAVSTHTSSRGLIGAGKPPRSSRLPMILAVSTAAMAAVVVVLFVIGMVFRVF